MQRKLVFPSPQKMPATLPPPVTAWLPPPGRRRTQTLASLVLGGLALAQLLALGWFLARGGAAATARRVGVSPATNSSGGAVAATTTGTPAPRDLASAPSGEFPSAPTAPTPAAALPTPGTAAPAATGSEAAAGGSGGFALPTPAPRYQANPADLVEQAKVLRSRGDTQSALAKLREAQNLSADNPLVIAELALTYEAMQLPDRATLQWQRLYDLGESVGAPYYLAQMKLRQSGGIPGETAAAASPPTAAAGGGYAANALLRLVEVKQEEVPDPSAEKKVAVRIVVKNRPGSAIDPRRVKVFAEFYDLVDGKDLVQTDAETGFQWLTPPVDWADDASEILEVTYLRRKDSAGGAGASGNSNSSTTPLLPPPPIPAATGSGRNRRGGNSSRNAAATPLPSQTEAAAATPARTYVGYVVRLYYDRQLQDGKAEPEQLLQKFTPPPTLPAEQ